MTSAGKLTKAFFLSEMFFFSPVKCAEIYYWFKSAQICIDLVLIAELLASSGFHCNLCPRAFMGLPRLESSEQISVWNKIS